MEMSAYLNISDSKNVNGDCSFERYLTQALNEELEAQTVELIRNTLMLLPESGSELAATRRKLDNFYASYTQDGSIYLVLIDRKTASVVGGVGVLAFAGLDPSEGIGEIRELAVDIAYRRQGLGLALIQAAFATALNFKYKRLYLEATAEMSHAQALFLRFGFKPVALKSRESGIREEPLIRLEGKPAFYVWEDTASLTNAPAHPHK